MKKKSSTSYQFSRSYLHHLVPVLVWLGTVAVVVGLFYQRSLRFEVLGIAQPRVYQIAATCTGRLKDIPVQLFDEVQSGQVVAVLDTVLDNEPLAAELAAIAAEIERLTAQLIPTQEQLLAEAANLQTNLIGGKRRFYVDVENARLQILQLRALIASDRITLDDLAMEVKVTESLLEQEAVVPYELQRVKAQYNSLAKKVEENESLLQQAKDDLQQAQKRLDEFTQRQPEHPTVDSALEVIRKEVAVQERLMDQLIARRKPLELKSPVHGIVVQAQDQAAGVVSPRTTEKIFRKLGEVVSAADPILAVAEIEPTEIVAYVSEQQLQDVREKMMVELIKNTEPQQIASSQVVCVGPTVELIPQRLWRNPNMPQWGRPILVKVPPGLRAIPGEIIAIRGL